MTKSMSDNESPEPQKPAEPTITSESLFQPMKLGTLEIPNRIAMAPMTRSFSPGGLPGENVAQYYEKRAKGGVGLIITEGTSINDPSSAGYPDVPVMNSDSVEAWKNVVNKVHHYGAKIAMQLWHVGILRKMDFDKEGSIPSLSPSGIYYLEPRVKPLHTSKVMEQEDIDRIIKAYVDSAVAAQSAGFDAIEIHGAHGYLIDQFFWETTNKRTDKYGGPSYKERTQFVREIVAAMREKVGAEMPIILRFSNWKLEAYGQHLFKSPEALEEFLSPLADCGLTGFHASSREYDKPEFNNSHLNLAGWVKKMTGMPSISVGSVGLTRDFTKGRNAKAHPTTLKPLFSRMNKAEFDLIAIGRSLLADPEWANKVRMDQTSQIIPFEKKYIEELI